MKRSSIRLASLLCLALALPSFADKHPKLSIQTKDKVHQVMIGDELFVGYNPTNTQKPYLYPIIGPTGANMTRHYPLKKDIAGESDDHPHHTSLWFTHGGINGVDFWHGKSGAGVVTNLSSKQPETPGQWPAIEAADRWLKPDRSKLADSITDYQFSVLDDGARIIEYKTMIKPALGIDELIFADTKEGTMAIRLAPQLRLKGKVATGKAINSEGDKDRAVWGKRAKWVAYWGVIDGKTCGVAIFDHPSNLRHPTWWHARDYGLVAANPFGISDFERGKHKRGAGNHAVKQGEALSLRYYFVFFAGTAEEADIAGKYEQWVKKTTSEEE
ncbi:MAG: PmoA family protein [Planctomycetota bacterium]